MAADGTKHPFTLLVGEAETNRNADIKPHRRAGSSGQLFLGR